ncbi:MAG: hypothetical protein R3305_07735, partial [Gammaproteobacteria bacterium]|nr:hypothetical protein [Gammaproteobacteria bacterium]
FDPEMIPFEPSPPVVRDYQAIEELIAAGEYEDALRMSRRLIETGNLRLADIGVIFVQNSNIHTALGNVHEAYEAIRRVTYPGLPLLQTSELAVALAIRNTLELRLGDVVGALETFERRTELGPVPDDDLMATRVERIRTALDGDAAIAVQGKILGDAWQHELTRRTFAIGDLEGSLSRINVECDQRRIELEYSIDVEWSLPDGWGACTAFVEGRGDTEFVFYEFR